LSSPVQSTPSKWDGGSKVKSGIVKEDVPVTSFEVSAAHKRAYHFCAERKNFLRAPYVPVRTYARFGGKATVMLLHGIWSRNDKYAKVDGIKRCWRKADILPPSWNQQINNEVGSASLSDRDKKISDEDCNVLCNLMTKIQLKSANSIDTVNMALSLHASFAVDPS
jgi:hypothetical protein